MKPRIWINKIKFSDDTEISLEKDDIVVFVGPNNSGKTVSLNELSSKIQNQNNETKVIKEIEIEKEGSVDELLSFLESISIVRKDTNNPNNPNFLGYGYSLRLNNIRNQWQNNNQEFRELSSIFINLLKTENRLTATNPPENIALTSQPPQHPIHFLQKDDSIESKFNNYFKQAFGLDIVIHRNAGNKVPIYIGEKPDFEEGEDRVSISYTQKVEKLDLLHKQGDGMRSFMGVLLNSFLSYHSIICIDEPEAFLHPPQARLIGKMLGEDLPSERQLFLATHNLDFLKGLLDSKAKNIHIIRIERDGNINPVRHLDRQDIEKIWNDPILKHSNILDGLFHTHVILCESDSDCRFYSAITNSLYSDSEKPMPDILFIHSGGKDRMPVIIKALKDLNIRISVICDFDVLNDHQPIQNIYKSLGGDWDSVQTKWHSVKKAIEDKKPELQIDEAKQQINETLDNNSEKYLTKKSIRDIKKILRKTSAWSYAKEQGKNFIPNGQPTQDYQILVEELNQAGLYVVEIGELESFCKSVGNHGPKWVNEVLQKDLKSDSELEEARNFVEKIVK
ncbi:MAG: ATP-dependent nuclease [Candidatus Woesearchaeota archaeon]